MRHVGIGVSAQRQDALSGAGDPRVVAALEEYISEVEAGLSPDREAFLARHAGIAPALKACLDGVTLLHSAAPHFAPEAGSDEFGLPGRLGDYQIIREVGRGGMGVVYEARQVSLSRRVALKVLPSSAALDQKHRLRFQVEAQAAAHLNDPHIVPVYAVGHDRGVHYYAMQFIEGRTIADMIAELRGQAAADEATRTLPSATSSPSKCETPVTVERGEPTEFAQGRSGLREKASGSGSGADSSKARKSFFRQVADLGVQAAEALEHAHALGVLHRDVKPANLMIDASNHLWVTDFGLARLQSASDANLTVSGDLVGTLRYMSPEQALGKRVVIDHRTDVYSLGVTLYELITLRPAYDGRDRQEVLHQIAQEEPPAPRRVRPGIPRDLETIVLKAMAREPVHRYQSAQELADDLRRFINDQPILAHRPTPIERVSRWARRHRLVVLAAAAVVLLAAIGFFVGFMLVLNQKQQTDKNLNVAFRSLDKLLDHLSESRTEIDPEREHEVKALLNESLQIYEHLAQQNPNPSTQWEKAKALHRVGAIRYRIEDYEKSEEAFRESERLLERLIVQFPANPQYREVYAEVINHVVNADLQHMKRGSKDAQSIRAKVFRSLDLAKGLADEFPSDKRYRLRLGQTQNLAGTALGLLSGPAIQEKMFNDAVHTLEALSKEWSDSPQTRAALAQAYASLGQVYRFSQRPKLAKETFGRAIAELERLAEQDPGNLEFRRTIASHYSTICCPLITNPQLEPAEAERAYRKALGEWAKIAEKFPGDHSIRESYIGTQSILVSLMINTGRRAEAEQMRAQAIAGAEKLVAEYPKAPRFKRLLAGLLMDKLIMHMFAQKHDKNVELLQRVLELVAQGAELPPVQINNLAWFLVTAPKRPQRYLDASLALAKHAVARMPEMGEYWNTLGVAQLYSGDLPSAKASLEKSMDLRKGGDPNDWLFMAMVQHKLGNTDAARTWIEQSERWLAQADPKRRSDLAELKRFRDEARRELQLPAVPVVSQSIHDAAAQKTVRRASPPTSTRTFRAGSPALVPDDQ